MVDINSEDTAVTDHLVDKKYNNPLDLRSLQETIDNFPGVSASENENDEVLPRDSLPAWLLDRCITCSDEWDDHPDFVLPRDNMPSGTSDEAQENDGASECSNPAAMYEMDTILFEQFNGLLKPASGEEGDAGPDSTPNSGVRFAQSVVRLQTHIPAADECTASFLRAVVKQFAKNTGSDLITLTRDDLEDLANHFRPEEPSDDVSDGSSECSDDSDDTTYERCDYLEVLFRRRRLPPPPAPPSPPRPRAEAALPPGVVRIDPTFAQEPTQEPAPCDGFISDEDEEDPEAVDQAQLAPFARLLHKLEKVQWLASRPSSLIVHMFIDNVHLTDPLLLELQSTIDSFSDGENVLIIVSTETRPDDNPTYLFSRFASRPAIVFASVFKCPMSVVPVRSASQVALIKQDGKNELKSRNIAALKRAIRRKIQPHPSPILLSPLTDWEFLEGSPSAELLSQVSISDFHVEAVLRMIGHSFVDDTIKKAVLCLGVGDKALQAWDDLKVTLPPQPRHPLPGRPPGAPVRPLGGPPHPRPPMPLPPFPKFQLDPRNDIEPSEAVNGEDKWKDFPPATQRVLREITSGPQDFSCKYYWERQFLHLLVSPPKTEASWADIAIHPEAERTIRDLVRQHVDPDNSAPSYGILRRNHVGAALLYGPPGTGKTLLGRVLARESGSTVIYLTPADIRSPAMPVSDPSKPIRALFNLGKMLAPSIIMLDEVELLLGSRRAGTPYQIKSLASQLLSEMNGLSGSKKAPLVLFSTHSPGDLDAAVLRHAPNRIHLGLPSAAVREKIFDIALRDEILQPGLNSDLLARATPRFSGSDIVNLCVQAAGLCTTFVEDGEEDQGKRLLTWTLFQEALKKICPTWTKESLKGIQEFATKHDTAALASIEDLNAEEHLEEDDGFVEVPEF